MPEYPARPTIKIKFDSRLVSTTMTLSQPEAPEERIKQHENAHQHPLETKPVNQMPPGRIPNTPIAASTISFLLGCMFACGMILFCSGGLQSHWWATYQLGFFISAWSGFHWAEFAVTAGWNLEKCSVDCECTADTPSCDSLICRVLAFLLENGALYHIVNGLVVVEYLATLHIRPDLKANPKVTAIGWSHVSTQIILSNKCVQKGLPWPSLVNCYDQLL